MRFGNKHQLYTSYRRGVTPWISFLSEGAHFQRTPVRRIR